MSLMHLIYGKTGDATYQAPRLDSSTHTLQTIAYEHHEIHSGSHYFVSDVADLSINQVYDLQFTTPNTTKWIHLTFKLDCKAETEWFIYEAAVIVTAGTTVLPYNNNRNSANTSGTVITGAIYSGIAVAATATTTASSTKLEHGIIGAGRTGGDDSRSNEIILKQNTTYLMRAVANAAGYIDFVMQWYEHTDKSA